MVEKLKFKKQNYKVDMICRNLIFKFIIYQIGRTNFKALIQDLIDYLN